MTAMSDHTAGAAPAASNRSHTDSPRWKWRVAQVRIQLDGNCAPFVAQLVCVGSMDRSTVVPTCTAGAASETVVAKMLAANLVGVKALESASAPEQRAAELGTAEPSTNCRCYHIRCNL